MVDVNTVLVVVYQKSSCSFEALFVVRRRVRDGVSQGERRIAAVYERGVEGVAGRRDCFDAGQGPRDVHHGNGVSVTSDPRHLSALLRPCYSICSIMRITQVKVVNIIVPV